MCVLKVFCWYLRSLFPHTSKCDGPSLRLMQVKSPAELPTDAANCPVSRLYTWIWEEGGKGEQGGNADWYWYRFTWIRLSALLAVFKQAVRVVCFFVSKPCYAKHDLFYTKGRTRQQFSGIGITCKFSFSFANNAQYNSLAQKALR